MIATPAPVVRPPDGMWGDGGRIIFAVQVVRLIVRLCSAAALARLLSPEAYGLHGMAAAVFGFLYMGRDLGLITAVQQPGMTPARFQAICRFALVGGCTLALLGGLLAVPTGWFYREPNTVPWVLAGLSVAFVFAGLSAPAVGVLYRERKGGQAAAIDATGLAIGAAAGVTAAWAGWGVWSLVVLTVTHEAAACLIAWRACPWRWSLGTADRRWFAVASFGASLTGHNVAAYCTRILDQVTVGRTGGAAALGLYGRGAQVAALPAQFGLGPFTPWIVAGLARHRDEPAAQVQFFRRVLNNLLHVALAAAVVCIVLPDLTLLLLFGPQWLPAAPVVRWLGIALAFQPWLLAPVWLLSAQGEVRRLLHWSLAGALLMVVACLIAARHGMAAIAIAAATTAVLHAALGPVFCRGRTPVSLRHWWQPATTPLLLHGGLAAVWFATTALAPTTQGTGMRFAVLLAVAALYYGAMLLVWPKLRRELRHHLFWTR